MQSQSGVTSSGNGPSAAHDLFALTDEQILEIEPEPQDGSVSRDPLPVIREEKPHDYTGNSQSENRSSPDVEKPISGSQSTVTSSPTGHGTRGTEHDAAEPPAWLAAQMKDPWSGEEARELWNGVQQARSEAAAYRAAFATPEDARALKELYPGGVNEARSAASRARLLDDIDRSYFGVAGKSAEETSAARTQLAAMMLGEDPAAFREMVFAGLRALEEAGVAAGFSPPSDASHVGATLASPAADGGNAHAGAASLPGRAGPASTTTASGGSLGSRTTEHGTRDTAHEAHVAAYAAFEKAANEELERSVGAAIARTLEQALPNLRNSEQAAAVGARYIVPLQERLNAAVRQDVEAALKGDRQLGEQIAQILAARRFDNETRAQVVRLIDDRARQLVPGAAKRVLNDWTQTTLAAHRGSAARADTASTRREVEPASSDSGRASLAANSPRTAQTRTGTDPNRGATRHDSRRVNYRKLSDEQILDM